MMDDATGSQRFLQRLVEFLDFCETEFPHDVDAHLRILGLDPIKIAEKGHALASGLLKTKLEAERNSLREERLAAQTRASIFSSVNSNASPERIDTIIRESIHTHYFDGLNGVRCGFYVPGVSVHGALTWDSVTCPDCLKLKNDYEPWNVDIDTRGD